MPGRLRILGPLVGMLFVAMPPTVATAGPFPVQDVDPRPAAEGDTLAYTAVDSSGGLRLALRKGGAAVRLAVPARRRVFDVSLGTDAHQRQVATFTMCRDEATAFRGDDSPNDRGCSAMAVRTVAGARPRTVLAARGGLSFSYPVMVDGQVAAVVRDGKRVGLVVGGRGRPLRRIGLQRSVDEDPNELGLAFDGRRVVATWALSHDACPGRRAAQAGPFEWRAEVVGVRDGKRRTLLSDWCDGITNDLGSPSLVGDRLFVRGVTSRSTLIEVDLRTRKRRIGFFPDVIVDSAAVTSDRIVYAAASVTNNLRQLKVARR